MPVVDLTAGWLPILGEPGDPVSLAVTVPAGYQTGTWTANVWRDTRKGTPLAVATVNVAGQVVTPSWTPAQSLALAPAGTTRFSGYWEADRTVAGVGRTILKGPFVLATGFQTPGTGVQAVTLTINAGAVTVAGGALTMAEVTAAVAWRPVKVTYLTAAVSGVPVDGWYTHDLVAATFTGRNWPVIWEGTAAQIPAQGTGDADLQTGDIAVTRTSTL